MESCHQSVARFSCMICMDVKSTSEKFNNKACTHLFCSNCIAKHVAVKIQEKIPTVKCPDPKCQVTIELDLCRSILPQDVVGRWEDALCEFQNMKMTNSEREDSMVLELAKSMNWKRCPTCKFIIEKIDGCVHISCRCGSEFCYRCGILWTDTHACPA